MEEAQAIGGFVLEQMALVGAPPIGCFRDSSGHAVGADRLPEEMNEMKIRDDKVCHPIGLCYPSF